MKTLTLIATLVGLAAAFAWAEPHHQGAANWNQATTPNGHHTGNHYSC